MYLTVTAPKLQNNPARKTSIKALK